MIDESPLVFICLIPWNGRCSLAWTVAVLKEIGDRTTELDFPLQKPLPILFQFSFCVVDPTEVRTIFQKSIRFQIKWHFVYTLCD